MSLSGDLQMSSAGKYLSHTFDLNVRYPLRGTRLLHDTMFFMGIFPCYMFFIVLPVPYNESCRHSVVMTIQLKINYLKGSDAKI